MDTKEIRLAKLRQIITDRFDGVSGRCADALKMKRPQVSRWVTENEEARQGISDESAREIERILGYDRGWMDGLSPEKAIRSNTSRKETTAAHEPSRNQYQPSIRTRKLYELIDKLSAEQTDLLTDVAKAILRFTPQHIVKNAPESAVLCGKTVDNNTTMTTIIDEDGQINGENSNKQKY